MAVIFRTYSGKAGFTEDYFRVFDFLNKLNRDGVVNNNFLWGRWEWMISHYLLDRKNLHRIGLWMNEDEIVALATYEETVGHAWLIFEPRYRHLSDEMLAYAMDHLRKDGKLSIILNDADGEFQDAAAKMGFRPTQNREETAIIPIREETIGYHLPEGFRIVCLDEDYDLAKYNRVMWRGFNHEGPAPETEEKLASRKQELSGPHVDLRLKVAVAAPNGEFVAYCGMWHVPGNDYALVEPVATDPDYRMMGLGKAAVLEGIKRCGERGAKWAYVGSSQQFYYNIGFRPCSTYTWWNLRD
ncbi:GNAT family N-acetyltransferase [Gorillibacterium massiliense]|uniref:GNAT family N-acetyltransferase n=1 Tax=Gorillibacterium massiliense TaxID=1280390 RepID=UPI000594A129|nr:GNAT family N-acetyltransferase [Gorillibacterium massiliense]